MVETIDWPLAIDRNRDALLRIVETLFALIGLVENRTVATLPRHLRNTVLRILRPAESAARRLIVVAARGMEAPAFPACGEESGSDGSAARRAAERRKSQERGTCSFPLFDPRKRFDFAPRRRYATTSPRLRSLSNVSLPVYMRLPEPPERRLPTPDDPVSAARLCRRLAALKRALEDLDGQARRLTRRRARGEQDGKSRLPPMRPGWPPGHRRRPVHDVDDILRECHSLAVCAQRRGAS